MISPSESGQLRHALGAAIAELRLAAIEVEILEKAR